VSPTASPIEDFLVAIDQAWTGGPGPKIRLRVLGSAALMLQADYVRGTKDSDVLETADLTPEIKTQLLALAGKETALATTHHMYLDIVPRGLPFLPMVPAWHPLAALSQKLTHFEVEVLGVVDTVTSKLKRFSANDQADIKAMVERDLVEHSVLVERFVSAVDRFSGDARAEDLPLYVAHLHRIEREVFIVPESAIELPDWI